MMSSALLLPALSLTRRELVRFYRQRSRMIGVIASPLVFWFLIGSGLSGSFRHPSAPPDVNYLEYFFPGMIVLVILFTSIFSTISIIEDRREGFLQSVLVSPASRSGIALGKILGGTVLATLQAILLLALAPFVGFALNLWSALFIVFVFVVIAFGLTALGFLIAWRMDSTQGFHAIMNLFLIPLWLLSGSVFPPSGAAGWLSTIMTINPLSYGIAALREGFYMAAASSALDGPPVSVSLVVTIGFAMLTFILSTMTVRRVRLS